MRSCFLVCGWVGCLMKFDLYVFLCYGFVYLCFVNFELFFIFVIDMLLYCDDGCKLRDGEMIL